jgi:signal peptidase II
LNRRLPYMLLAAAIVALDLFTKQLILANFRLHESLPVIPNFFDLVYVRNYGAAFGLGNRTDSSLVPLLLSVGAVGVFIFVVIYSLKVAMTDRLLQTGLHLIMGGAIGNLIDRFRFGYVVDFLDFYVVVGGTERHWPAFNVADSAIVVGIGLLMLDMFRKPAEAEEPA